MVAGLGGVPAVALEEELVVAVAAAAAAAAVVVAVAAAAAVVAAVVAASAGVSSNSNRLRRANMRTPGHPLRHGFSRSRSSLRQRQSPEHWVWRIVQLLLPPNSTNLPVQ